MRLTLVYANTGQGHKTSADGLAEWVTKNSRESDTQAVHITHVDIYRSARVFQLGRAGRHYQFLCWNAKWLYNFLFRISDSRPAKKLIVRTIVQLYGKRIGRVIEHTHPDLIIVLHPLFMSDVLCELRGRMAGKWQIVSFVTDLGIAHTGWVSASLDAAIFVHPGQIEKLRDQRCLPPETPVFVAQAPVRATFSEYDELLDHKLIGALGLKRPYLLYVPGLQPRRSLVRQMKRLTEEFKNIQFVIIGSVPAGTISCLKIINNQMLHLESLSGIEMSAVMRNAEVIAGKAGPAVMAEAASVHARFIPTAEVGRQEAGNALEGQSMYGTDPMPPWGRKERRIPREHASNRARLADYLVMDDAEVYNLLKGMAEVNK
jgi:hypothetical protein